MGKYPSKDLSIRVYKQLFVFVVDGKLIGMPTENFASQLLINIAVNLPKRPQMNQPKRWKMQAWVLEDYEEFCVEQLNYSEIKIFKQSYKQEVVQEAVCDSGTFYKKLLISALYFIQQIEKKPCLLSKDSNISLNKVKQSVAWIKLYYDNHYLEKA